MPNLWRPPKISLILVKLQQSLSLLTSALSKSGEHTNDHHHCPMSVFILTTSRLEANTPRTSVWPLYFIHVGGGEGAERGGKVANHMMALLSWQ
jgi:hypothetical protein